MCVRVLYYKRACVEVIAGDVKGHCASSHLQCGRLFTSIDSGHANVAISLGRKALHISTLHVHQNFDFNKPAIQAMAVTSGWLADPIRPRTLVCRKAAGTCRQTDV